jgi:hypothetical protein
MGMSWWVYNFECTDVPAREALMDHFEREHPVEFPADRYSEFAEVNTPEGTTGADFAWIDRYLYVSVMADAEHLVHETVDHWERAAWAFLEATTETAQDVTFLFDKGAGDPDEAAARQFDGVEGLAGLDVMYALAATDGFRFRSYAAQSPTTQITPHPAALDAPPDLVDDVPSFVDEMEQVTGVEPTAAAWELLYADVAAAGDLAYGETHGPEDSSGEGLDAVHSVDLSTGEVATYESPGEVPEGEDEREQWLDRRYRQYLEDG